MANPQLENGYIRIANELYRAMYQIDLNAAELRILHFIVHQTYGYNKKSRRLSKSYIVNGTGLSVDAVKRSMKKLIDNNIIIAESERSNEAKILSVNKKFDNWRGGKNAPANLPMQKHTRRGGKNTPSEGAKMPPKTIQKKQDRKNNTECVLNTPNFEDVFSYFAECGFSKSCAQDFFDYNQGRGWKNVVDWKSFADKWMRNDDGSGKEESKVTLWGKEVKKDEWQ